MIEILYFEGCPNHEPTVALARVVVDELGHPVEVRETRVDTAEEAARRRFLGSPTVRVNGRDIEPEARGRTDFAMSCRMYRGSGVPPKELLLSALREEA